MNIILICAGAWSTATILWCGLRHIRSLLPLLCATGLAIPGVIAALDVHLMHTPFLQGICLAPLALLAPLNVTNALSPDLMRAAEGLGADARQRLRLIWWPAYARALGCAFCQPLAAACLIVTLNRLHTT